VGKKGTLVFFGSREMKEVSPGGFAPLPKDEPYIEAKGGYKDVLPKKKKLDPRKGKKNLEKQLVKEEDNKGERGKKTRGNLTDIFAEIY